MLLVEEDVEYFERVQSIIKYGWFYCVANILSYMLN